MPEIKSIVISAGRKASANYCTREAAYTVTLELTPDDKPGEVTKEWTRKLQAMTDEALGDRGEPGSFEATTNLKS